MFVQKQLIPAPFVGGIDTKSDSKQIPIGNLLELKNGQFTKRGQLNKRYGYDVLSTNIEGGGNITSAQAISSFNDELTVYDGSNVYSFVEATQTWLNRGTAISLIASDRMIVRMGNRQQLNPDVAFNQGIEVYAWEDSTGGIRYSVLDSATGATCISDGLIYSFGAQPKTISLGNSILVLYSDDVNNIFYNTVNPRNPTVLGPQTVLATDGYGVCGFDAQVIGDRLFLSYLSNGDGYSGGEIKLSCFDQNVAFLGSATIDSGSGAWTGGDFCIAVQGDSEANAWVAWGTGAEVRTAVVSHTLVPLLASTHLTTARVETITCAEQPSAPGTMTIALEIFAPDTMNERIQVMSLRRSDATVLTVGTIRSVGIASKAFVRSDHVYLNVAFDSPLQATYFTLQIDAEPFPIVAKISSQTAGGLRLNNTLSETVEVETGVFLWANQIKGKVNTEANTEFSFLGVNSTRLDFENPNKFISVVSSGSLLFVGGVVSSYDGVSVVEQNFHVYPENITALALGSGGSLSSGSYQYQVTYEWTDNTGKTQYSTPSVPILVNAVLNDSVRLTIPTLRLTSKQGDRSAPNVVIYRTSANGTLLNRITSVLAPLSNDPSVDTISFVDQASDDSIAANGLLYTTGGVLENSAPPACKLISLFQNRVVVGGLEDPNLLWFSKNRFDNSNFNTIPTEFSATNTIGCDPRGGGITAVAPLQDKLAIFKETAIFILTGNGPNDTGAGDVFSDPTLVTADVGCANPNSVQQTPMGLMFQSSKGIYLLANDVTIQYIGDKVEAYNSETITSTTVNAQSNQVIFTTESGTALVYDYYFSQWSTWTNHPAEDSDIFGGLFCYVRPNGRVYRQNMSVFTDGPGVPVLLQWTTPNISFAGIQGYQRVFRCLILGSYRGPHSLSVQVAYDFNDSYTESCSIDASQDVSVYGESTPYGRESPYGGAYQAYEFTIYFKTQKCTSVRLKVSDQQPGQYNEGYSISALTFEVGSMVGPNRIRSNRTAGTS